MDAASYVKSVCGSEVAWLSKLQARGATLGQSLSKLASAAGPGALKKGKAILVEYFAGSVADTNQLIASFQALGPPSVEGGDSVESQLVTALTTTRDLFAKGRSAMEALPINSTKVFVQQTSKAARDLQQASLTVAGSLTGVSNSALDKAFKSETTCSSLSGG